MIGTPRQYRDWADLAEHLDEDDIVYFVNKWFEHADEYFALKAAAVRLRARVEAGLEINAQRKARRQEDARKRAGGTPVVPPNGTQDKDPNHEDPNHGVGGREQGTTPHQGKRTRTLYQSVVHEGTRLGRKASGAGTAGRPETVREAQIRRLKEWHIHQQLDGLEPATRVDPSPQGGGTL